MAVRIITDSTSDIGLKQAKELGVDILPLTVHFGQEEYLDGVNLTNEMFYEKLLTSEELPTTSQITVTTFETVFNEIVKEGEDVYKRQVHQPRRGVKPTYDYKACIRCFCCQEMCPEQAIFVKKPLMARLADRKW